MTKKELTPDLSKTKNINAYDEVVYESYPHPMSSPHHACTLATLFGLAPANIDNAKVLELGCAGGGNLIPHAVNHPNAHFVGIDLSEVQIRDAKKIASKLKLKNIDFQLKSITDIDDSFGKFDYIIAHGVISWVPEDVQQKIFDICKNNLSENGVAYISYNALPGWNIARNIRDMMLYHSKIFDTAEEKVKQSRLFIDFIQDTLSQTGSTYSQIIDRESKSLKKHSDYYIYHDYLEKDNTQFYFHEFMQHADRHDLQYLSEGYISRMYLGNMPKKVSEKLKDVSNIIRTEQYMDFITNRRFRSTLLCHKNVKIKRNIEHHDLKKFNMMINVFPNKKLEEIDINDNLDSIEFVIKNKAESKISTSSPLMKALLYSFAHNLKNPLSFKKLLNKANSLLKGNRLGELEKELLANGMQLVLKGIMQLTLIPERSYNENMPKVSELTRYQAANNKKMLVTNQLHESVRIVDFEKLAFEFMDGKNSIDEINAKIVKIISENDITLTINDKVVKSEAEIKNYVTNSLAATIKKAESNALLI